MTDQELQEAVRRYSEERYPEAAYAVVVIHLADGVPDATVPVVLTAPSGPAGPPRSGAAAPST